MKKVTMIVMPGCPYCANAKKALAALQKEAAYRDVQVELVDVAVLGPDAPDLADAARGDLLARPAQRRQEAAP